MWKLEFWKLEIKFGNYNLKKMFKEEVLINKRNNKNSKNNN